MDLAAVPSTVTGSSCDRDLSKKTRSRPHNTIPQQHWLLHIRHHQSAPSSSLVLPPSTLNNTQNAQQSLYEPSNERSRTCPHSVVHGPQIPMTGRQLLNLHTRLPDSQATPASQQQRPKTMHSCKPPPIMRP